MNTGANADTRATADSAGTDAIVRLYRGYESWKGWAHTFTYTADDAAYFAAETRGIPLSGSTLLEVGFGAGNFLAWAKDQGATVAGTEINRASLEAACAKGVEILPAAFETVAEAHACRFDVVAAFDVFEHFSLDEVITRLAAAERMLKPGGYLVLRFPNAQSPFGLAPQFGDLTHKSALARSAFEQLIQGTSFEICRYAGSHLVGGGGLARSLARFVRRSVRKLIGRTLNAIYAQDIPWDPVVTLVMRRS